MVIFSAGAVVSRLMGIPTNGAPTSVTIKRCSADKYKTLMQSIKIFIKNTKKQLTIHTEMWYINLVLI